MTQSLKDYGQVSPITVCQLEGQTVLVDGFKRLHAARSLEGFTHLKASTLEVDEQGAKAALFNLNRIAGRPVELEEAWIIYALVREDGLQQIEAALMLGRHKSWVNRRLALIERLCDEAREALRQSQADYVHQWDPRMSASGNRVTKRLTLLLDCLAKMNTWLRYTGRAELQAVDREPLTSGFVKL